MTANATLAASLPAHEDGHRTPTLLSLSRVAPEDVLVFESVLHGVRLLLELGLSDTEPRDVELAVFEFFFVAGALRGARFFVRGLAVWWQNLLPTLALALHFAAVSRVYELVSLTLLAASFVSGTDLGFRQCIVAYTFAQLFTLRAASNVLRVMALTALFASANASSLVNAKVLAALAMELASWSTERYLMPWRLPAGDACCGYAARFAIGFFIGVHYTDARAEAPCLLLRDEGARRARLPTLRGVAVHGGESRKASLRYEATPLGTLLAYAEGLGVFASRLEVEEEEEEKEGDEAVVVVPAAAVAVVAASRRARRGRRRTLRVYLWGGWNVLDVDVSTWTRPDPASPSLPSSLAASSRIPFRRLLLGLLLRVATR